MTPKGLQRAAGASIRMHRQAYGISQADLARAVKIAPANLSAIETGNRIASLELLAKLAVAMGSYLTVILNESEDPRDVKRRAKLQRRK